MAQLPDEDEDTGATHIDTAPATANRAKARTVNTSPPAQPKERSGSAAEHMFAHGRPRTDGY